LNLAMSRHWTITPLEDLGIFNHSKFRRFEDILLHTVSTFGAKPSFCETRMIPHLYSGIKGTHRTFHMNRFKLNIGLFKYYLQNYHYRKSIITHFFSHLCDRYSPKKDKEVRN